MPHRFRALFNHTQDAVWMADEHGRIAEVNPAALARFGLAADGGEPRHLGDLFHDPAEWESIRAELADGTHVPVSRSRAQALRRLGL